MMPPRHTVIPANAGIHHSASAGTIVLRNEPARLMDEWMPACAGMTLDHRHLNDVFGHGAVTAEFLALTLFEWCAERWPETSAVRVSETPKTWATYRPVAAT